MLRTPTYHVFHMYKVHQDATRLEVKTDAGLYRYDEQELPAITATASKDSNGAIHISICHLDPNHAASLALKLEGIEKPLSAANVSGELLTANELNAHNTFEQPNKVEPVAYGPTSVSGQELKLDVPPSSVLRLTIRP